MKKFARFSSAGALLAGLMGWLFPVHPAPADSNVRSETNLSLAASTRPEAKLSLTQSFIIPCLRGESPLTQDNQIKTDITAEISPISVNLLANAALRPAAFFELSAGAFIGSGWNINLFGGDIYGIGINRRAPDGKGEVRGSPFEGLFWGAKAGAALQADLAAVIPGDWHHVVARTYHELNAKGFSAAEGGETWVFENETFENRNGLSYYGNFLIGYQMPLFFNFAALMAELALYCYDTPGRSAWGDHIPRWTFSLLGNFAVTSWLGAALIVQCRTMRNYHDETLFYQDRRLNRENPLRLEFYRAAAILTFRIR
jgi:hypothetical protein